MLRQTVRREHVGISRIADRTRIWIVGTLLLLRCGIVLLSIKRIFCYRLQRLVVSWQRPVFQSAGDINPSHTISVQSEGTCSAESSHSNPAIQAVRRGGREILGIVRIVESSPFLFLF